MAESTVAKGKRDGTITIEDGTTPTPAAYEVGCEPGDFTWSREKAERVVARDRGDFCTVRRGDLPIITGSFTVNMRNMINGTDLTLVDVIDGIGAASAWVPVSTQVEEHSVRIVHRVSGTPYGAVNDGADHVATFEPCVCTWEFSEGDINSITVNFECFGDVVLTGPT